MRTEAFCCRTNHVTPITGSLNAGGFVVAHVLASVFSYTSASICQAWHSTPACPCLAVPSRQGKAESSSCDNSVASDGLHPLTHLHHRVGDPHHHDQHLLDQPAEHAQLEHDHEGGDGGNTVDLHGGLSWVIVYTRCPVVPCPGQQERSLPFPASGQCRLRS